MNGIYSNPLNDLVILIVRWLFNIPEGVLV